MFTFSDNNDQRNRKINWKLFILFLIMCLFAGFLLVYWLFPGYISEEDIRKIPIIIDEDPDEVKNILAGKV
jgi:hypothetical protein